MAITKYPSTISQTSQTNTRYREFNSLANLKNNKSTYAKTGQIASKSGTHNRPSTITATNFKCNVPTGSAISKITVEFAHAYEGNIAIAAPTVSLVGISVSSKKASGVTKTVKQNKVAFKVSTTSSKVNSKEFGVKINYPTNTKYDVGYLKIQYIRVVVEYKAPSYSIAANKVSGNYTDEMFQLKATISNKNKTSNNPPVTIKLPTGVAFNSKDSGTGSITQSGSTLTWNPQLGSTVTSSSIILNLSITTTGNHNIILSESVSNSSKTINITAQTRPEDTDTTPQNYADEVSPNNINKVVANEEFTVDLRLTDEEKQVFIDAEQSYFTVTGWYNFYYKNENTWEELEWVDFNLTDLDEDNNITISAKCSTVGRQEIYIYGTDAVGVLKKIVFDVAPLESSLSRPPFVVLQLNDEEINRLGDGYPYKVQSYLKWVGSYELATPRTWYKNFRIGVFNNPIAANVTTVTIIDEESENGYNTITIDPTNYDELDDVTIFENAEYWSNGITVPNEYQSIECDFDYEEDYPVYIIIVGDYNDYYEEGEKFSFTEPCVIEDDENYVGSEINGVYPQPILSTISVGNEPAILQVPLYSKSSDVVFYKIPLEEDFGTTDSYAIRGMELSLDVDYADEISLNFKLKSPTGESGERSIILNSSGEESSQTVKVGGIYDTWGFSLSELTKLNNWEIEIYANNNFTNTNDNAAIKFDNLQWTFYIVEIEKQVVDILVNGENVSAYGMFVLDAKVPFGLKTDVEYLEIDGSDINDAFRQNIKKKEITLDFVVDGCDLNDTTLILKQLAKLFTNKRDELNRPILNTIEISAFPNEVWEFLLEDGFDTETDVTNYKGSVSLVIPDGTSYLKDDTVTNTSGTNSSLVKVHPLITMTGYQGGQIEVIENIQSTKPSFRIFIDSIPDLTVTQDGTTVSINYNTIFEIDCANRRVFIRPTSDSIESVDITQYVDFSSDWFTIHDEYNFSSVNCVIQSIKFRQRG